MLPFASLRSNCVDLADSVSTSSPSMRSKRPAGIGSSSSTTGVAGSSPRSGASRCDRPGGQAILSMMPMGRRGAARGMSRMASAKQLCLDATPSGRGLAHRSTETTQQIRVSHRRAKGRGDADQDTHELRAIGSSTRPAVRQHALRDRRESRHRIDFCRSPLRSFDRSNLLKIEPANLVGALRLGRS